MLYSFLFYFIYFGIIIWYISKKSFFQLPTANYFTMTLSRKIASTLTLFGKSNAPLLSTLTRSSAQSLVHVSTIKPVLSSKLFVRFSHYDVPSENNKALRPPVTIVDIQKLYKNKIPISVCSGAFAFITPLFIWHNIMTEFFFPTS